MKTPAKTETACPSVTLDPPVGPTELAALMFISAQFSELFEGRGASDVERAQDALRRAMQIMANLTPLLSQLAQQVPEYTANSLPYEWHAPNAEVSGAGTASAGLPG